MRVKAAWLSALFLPVVPDHQCFGVAMVVLVGGYRYTIGGMTLKSIQGSSVYHVHVVADSTVGDGLCQHAAGGRFGRTDFLADR